MRPIPARDWLRRSLAVEAGWGPCPAAPGAAEWPSIMEWAGRHRLLPWLSTLPGLSAPPEHAATLRSEAALAGRQALVRAEGLARLDRLRRAHGVEAVFLKGAVVAPLLYSTLSRRGMRDADLWVRDTDQAARLQGLLRLEGLRTTRSMPSDHHHLDPLLDLSAAFTVEIHTNLAAPALPEAALADLWAMREPAPRDLPRLNDTGLFLHHALHALNDPVDGALLRDLWETARLAERLDAIQWQTALAWAEAHDQAGRIGDALALARAEFGFERDWPPARPRSFAFRCAAQRLVAPLPLRRFDRAWLRLLAQGLEEVQHRPETSGLAAILRVSGRAVHSILRSAPRRLRRAIAPRYRRLEGNVLELGDDVLLHDPESGRVHVLNAAGTRVYRECGTARDRAELERIAGGGLPGEDCVRALARGGVLRAE